MYVSEPKCVISCKLAYSNNETKSLEMILKAILSVTLILFSVIDIIGSLPVILDLKKKGVTIQPLTATFAAGFLMVSFLFFGSSILGIFHIEVSSFALAGSLIIFFIGLEMTLGIRFFRDEQEGTASGTIVPIVFPLLAGAGTLTTILTLKSEYNVYAIITGIVLNLVLIYIVLRSMGWIERKLTEQAANNLRKIFGIILIAIAIQMFKSNILG